MPSQSPQTHEANLHAGFQLSGQGCSIFHPVPQAESCAFHITFPSQASLLLSFYLDFTQIHVGEAKGSHRTGYRETYALSPAFPVAPSKRQKAPVKSVTPTPSTPRPYVCWRTHTVWVAGLSLPQLVTVSPDRSPTTLRRHGGEPAPRSGPLHPAPPAQPPGWAAGEQPRACQESFPESCSHLHTLCDSRGPRGPAACMPLSPHSLAANA